MAVKNIIKIAPTSDNMTPIFNQIIEEVKNSGGETVIELEQGDYYFKRSGSKKRRLYSSGTHSCENYVLFPIENIKNLTIEGNNSNFIYCDRVQPFLISESENITLRNFTTDYSFYRYAYAKVLAVNDEGFEIELNKNEFDYFVSDGFLNFVCGEDVLSTRSRQISMRRFLPTKSGVTFLRVGNCEAHLNKAALNLYADAVETKNGVFFKYRECTECKAEYECGDTIILGYDNNREAQAFYCEFSKNIQLQNVCIYRNGGMGFVADICENIILDEYKIMKKAGREEYFTSTADGIFLTNCSGDFVLRNSYISDTYDDAMNVHGYYTKIEEVLSPKKVKLMQAHPAHDGFIPCFKGDKLHLSYEGTLNEAFVLEVEDISYDENRDNIILTFKEEAELKVGMLVENPDRTPNVLIENNIVKRAPHIRLSARNMIVRNNDFSLEYCDIYIDDLIDFWGESGAVKNVLISGNKFSNTSPRNISISSCRPDASNHLHENVVICDNIFKRSKEEALSISGIKNIEIKDNVFEAQCDD